MADILTYLNSNIEIHKLIIPLLNLLFMIYLNSNIEIHKLAYTLIQIVIEII